MTREEAIKILREAHDNALFSVRTALETLIPELQESEDERMLQTIIRGFENCKRNGMEIFNNTKIDDILVYLEKQKEIGIQWLKSDNVKNPDKPYIDKAGMFYTTDGRMCYASEIGKQKSVEWDEYTKINLDRALQIIKKAKGTLQGYQSDDGIYECDKAIECLEHFLYRGLEIEKHTECIEFANEFDSQVSHLLVSVLNGEHEYNKDFVKYAAQSLLGYAKNELKSDELNEREKLMKALQTSNAQIGELIEENYKLKEQKPVEINEYEIIKKHITDDSLSSEVNKRLKECGWYVTDEKPAEWNEDCNEEDIQTRFAFYTYKNDPSVLYLSNVFVEEASRNHGFGSRILKAAEKVAETIGATTICLKVKQDSPANAWYRKNGYNYVTIDAFDNEYDWLEKNLEYMKPNKPEWSKEDEIRLKEALGVLSESIKHLPIGYGFVEDVRLVKDWLKSLPGRFNFQPKQEWSDEDETAFGDLMWCIKQAAKFAKDENDMGNIWFAENWVKNRLKSLRPQPKREWSEEDKTMLKVAIAVLRRYSHDDVANFLKSLRPSWKPTEEQMEALKCAVEDVAKFSKRGGRQVELENEPYYSALHSLYCNLEKLT